MCIADEMVADTKGQSQKQTYNLPNQFERAKQGPYLIIDNS